MARSSSVSQSGLYLLAQDRLSTGGNFILCDACANRCPIRYASRGFGELFGYTPNECLGKNCGDLVGSTAVMVSDPGFTRAAESSGLTPKQVGTGIQRQMARLAEQVHQLLEYPRVPGRVMFAHVLNVTKDGGLRVIELIMMIRQLPVGWPYLVGIQHDITDDVSIGQLLRAELRNDIGQLVESREAAICETMSRLGTNTSQVKLFLNEKAVEVWKELLGAMPHDGNDAQTQLTSSHDHASQESQKSDEFASPVGSLAESLKRDEELRQLRVADVESEVSFAITATTAFPLATTCNVAVQTDSLLVTPVDSTENTEVDSSTSRKERSLEPRVFASPPNSAKNVRLAGRPPKPYHVSLNTRHCVLRTFRETNSNTISQIIAQALRLFNPRGKGCCFWHISLHVLKNQIFGMLRMPCKPDFKPFADWQCGNCYALQQLDEDDEDDEFGADCSLCGRFHNGQGDLQNAGEHELESDSDTSLDSATAEC